jgi:soluble lytic murein transglycosylase
MMARHRLGIRQDFNFGVAMQADPSHLARIGGSPEGKRAFGLIQIGMVHHAGEELLRQYKAQGEQMSETYLAIADRGSLPDLAYYVSAQVYTKTGRMYDPGLYPVPDWKPQGGFQLDRSVLFAIMRQESAFQPKVISKANARGLMQLIPPTAVLMASDNRLRTQLGRLFDPEFNMELGQRYLRHLLKTPELGGNVAFAAAAYNAGEGALAKWQLRDDALMWMATIPYAETREYVERVLYNVAAYRLRLGQNPSELEDLTQNRWPLYRSQDQQAQIGTVGTPW